MYLPMMTERLVRIARGASVKDTGPFKLFLQTTDRCNLRCPSCGYTDDPPTNTEKELPESRLVEIVEEAAELGVEHVYLGGGEVFMRKRETLAVMERVKACGMAGDLTTNLTLLDEGDLGRIAAMGWDVMCVSLDAPNAALNDYLRPPASFRRIERGLKTLARLTNGFAKRGPHVKLDLVLSRINLPALPDFVRYAAELGVREVWVNAILPISRQYEALKLRDPDYALLRDLLPRAVELADEAGLIHNLDSFYREDFVRNASGNVGALLRADVDVPKAGEVAWRKSLSRNVLGAACYAPLSLMVVYPDGVVAPCWMHDNGKRDNVREKSLRAIWEGEAFDEVRKFFAGGGVASYCERCCYGQIFINRVDRARAYAAGGDYAAAEVTIGSVLELVPRDPELLALLLVTVTALRGVEAAREAYVAHEQRHGVRVSLSWVREQIIERDIVGRARDLLELTIPDPHTARAA